MRRTLVPMSVLTLAACGPAPVDLTLPVSDGAVVAGVIDDEAALFGGSAAEGRLGDVLIQNSVARFVIQGAREDGHYYETVGGAVIDADIARAPGEPGRDPVDEWSGMYGLGRIGRATSVEVVDDGVKSGAAVVRVTGTESPLTLLTGTLEDPGFVPDLGLTVVTEYTLLPDTPLLQVTTTLSASSTVELGPGDLLQGGLETVQPWDPGVGLDTPGDDDRRFTAYLGRRNEGAWAIVPPPGRAAPAGGGALLTSVVDLLATFDEMTTVTPDAPLTYTRYYAVGRDLGQITDAVYALDGIATRTEEGVVTAGGSPVPGARVHVLVDGEPATVAFTDAQGRFAVQVPEGAAVEVRATGDVDAPTLDLPAGWGPAGPYVAETPAAASRASLEQGSGRIEPAQGFGLAPVEDPLTLAPPARLTVRVDDGAPFEAMVLGVTGEADPRFVSRLERGTGLAWATDGEVELTVPAGEVRLVAHRGIRFERDEQVLTLAPGESRTVEVSLPAAFEHDGWLLGDPHSHAGPSPDGQTLMEERLLGTAARGIQLHFGTDHDHIADYRPLVAPMGLDGALVSIPASEVSPTLRGHMNVYPLTPDPQASNGGAPRWWTDLPDTTDDLVQEMLGLGDEVFVQMNHPLEPTGVAHAARWQTGRIRTPDRWSASYTLVEVDNAGEIGRNLDFFLDLITRGYRVAPVSVSDAHGPTSGGLGLNTTFFGTGAGLDTFDEAALVEVLRSGRTVASRGVFLDLSVAPGSTVTGPVSLVVEARSASWAPVDRLILLKDGVEAERVDGPGPATFELSPEADAVYVVVAEGDTGMGGPWGSETPWALASPIYVDLGGDGWTPPLPPLEQ